MSDALSAAPKSAVPLWGQTSRSAWMALLGVLGGLLGLAYTVQQPPPPRGLTAPEDSFSEARALAVVRKLADEIGSHPISSPAAATAAEYLAAELRRMPRVEVMVQDAQGDNRMGLWQGISFHYRVRNVVGRLPGRLPDAILINAHYDSPPEALGGSDNGIGTAAALEAMRALAAGPPLTMTVILCLNGGEEAGSVGAAGFLQHPFAKQVRAFIDTDGSGAGKAVLVQASSQVPGLLRAYARAARSPQASVFVNDLAQSGLLMFSGDYEPLSRAGAPGLDFAALWDVWGVHTHLDSSSRLAPGTLQSLGETILAVTRELARDAPDLSLQPEPTVFYDLLGQATVVYSMRTARLLALGALALLLGTMGLLLRRGAMTGGQLVRSLGWTLLSALAGLLSALLWALFLAVILNRPHGFYATPILAVPTYVGAGLCGVLAVHTLWRRRALARGMSAETSARTGWAGGLLLWGVLLALCALRSVGIGYLALWWVGPSALALGLGYVLPRLRLWLWLAGMFLGAAGFIQLAVGMVPAIIGLSGQVPLPPPADVKLAVLLWLLVVFPVALGGMPMIHEAGQLRRALALCGVITLIGSAATALRFPYSAARPKRIMATHAEKDGQSALLLMSTDYLPLAPALAALPEVQPVAAEESWPNSLLPPGWLPPYSHKLPARALAISPPRLEVLGSNQDAASGIRTVKLRLHASGWLTNLDIPRQALAGWSLGEPLPQPLEGQSLITASFFAPSPEGQELTLQLRGAGAVEVLLRQVHAPGTTPELLELRRRLPDWTTIHAHTLQVVKVQL